MHSGRYPACRYYFIRRCISAISYYWFLCPGYRLSPQAMNCIIKRYSTQGKIIFDDYVACCVKLRALTGTLDNFYTLLTEFLSSFIHHRSTVFWFAHWHVTSSSDIFRRRDQAQNGTASFQYDDVCMTVPYKILT